MQASGFLSQPSQLVPTRPTTVNVKRRHQILGPMSGFYQSKNFYAGLAM